MKVKIKFSTSGEVKDFEVSKCLFVEDLRKLVFDAFGVDPARQRLLYSGKCFTDGNDLMDYKVGSGHIIQLMERIPFEEIPGSSSNKGEQSSFKGEVEPDSGVDSPPGSSSGSDIGTASTSTQSLEDIRKLCPELAKEIEGENSREGATGEGEEQPDPPCKVCKNNTRRKCRECGCSICGGREEPETQLFCEECQYVTHMACLKPPLEKIPDGDWYCPECKNSDDIIKAGQKVGLTKKTAKMPSRVAKETNKKIRDWGKGEGCTGRRKVCTKVPPHHFGPIPGIEVGMIWESRMQLSEEGIHRPPVAGIAGTPEIGSPSLVLSGGYEDDVDNGIEFLYTGAGGRDLSNNKRTGAPCEDQKFEKVNKALARCCAAPLSADGAKAKDWTQGKPIRVSRSYKSKKHSEYAPSEGYRYDGMYKVVKYWVQKSTSHDFKVFRYLLRRDDPETAPWEEGAKQFRMIKKAVDEEKAKAKKRKAEDENDENDQTAKKIKIQMYKLDKKTKDIINKDERNAKLWKECLDFEAETKLEWINNVEEHFTCVCCQDIIRKPVTTDCGHNMCRDCYKRSLKADVLRCPSCRAEMSAELKINKECADALMAVFPGYDS